MTMTSPDTPAGRRGRIPWRWLRWAGAGLLLMLPWAAMRFTDAGVNWTGSDFVVFAAMLATALGGYELATLGPPDAVYRAGAAVALLTGFMLVWISLAVGIIGSETNPANLMYGGVLGVGLLGAVAARGRARGMAVALAATALAHALVAALAAIDGWAYTLIPNGVFVAMWLASAHLFHRAGQGTARGNAGA